MVAYGTRKVHCNSAYCQLFCSAITLQLAHHLFPRNKLRLSKCVFVYLLHRFLLKTTISNYHSFHIRKDISTILTYRRTSWCLVPKDEVRVWPLLLHIGVNIETKQNKTKEELSMIICNKNNYKKMTTQTKYFKIFLKSIFLIK